MNTQELETERKYLIRMPDAAFLSRGEVWEIRQTYLTAAKGNRRVREVRTRDKTQYIYTEKERVSALTSVEREREIDLAAYRTLLTDARPDSAEVVKTRYRIPYAGHTLEIDVYPFSQDKAIMRAALPENAPVLTAPPEITVLREVTGDPAYKNRQLAKNQRL